MEWTPDRLRSELAAVIGSSPYFPTYRDLASIGRTDLATAVTRHGGADHWATELGVSVRPPQTGYTSEMAVAEARRVIAERGHLPGVNKLRQLDHGQLAERVLQAGGAAAFCAAHGLPAPPATRRGQTQRRPPR